MRFIKALPLDELKPGQCRAIELEGGYGIALCNVEGEIFALDNTCPHAGGPLGEGTLRGDIVECPWHGWKFHVRTGQRVKNPSPEWTVPHYAVKVEDGMIQVSIPLSTPSDHGEVSD